MYRIDTLLKSDQKLFHTKDLALLWHIKNKNTLYTTIKRYVDRGILNPIHKGFYSTIPVHEVDPVRLGIGYLHTFAYLSCESILVKHGIIFQKSEYITLVSNKSTRFNTGDSNYLVRKLSDQYLFNPKGITNDYGVYRADLERALADMLYFNRRYHFDARDKILWRKVRQIQKEVYGL